MKRCRACLSTGKGMIVMDESFIQNYNILTSLNLTLTEDVPLYACRTCFDGAKFCIDFRNKCIASDQALRKINITQDILEEKQEEDKNCNVITIKKEVKLEFNDDSLGGYSDICNNDDKNDVYLEISNKIIKKEKKNKSSHKSKIKEENIIRSKMDCRICLENLEDEESLKEHLGNHKINVPCAQCGESFINLPHLLGHRIEHLPDKEKRCHICSKRFNTSTNLEFHYMRIHEFAEKDEPIQCKKCPATYTRCKSLRSHIGYYHSENKFKCEHCPIGFGRKLQLIIHMHTHGQIKRYECGLCDYTSKHPGGIRAHKLRKHTEGRVYCKTCYHAFSCQTVLDKHKCKRALGIICTVCGKFIKTSSGDSLQRHMRSHDEIGRYKCDKCPANFKSRSNYNSHMDKHAGTPKYQCEYCQRSFYSSPVLRKHRRTHTGEKPYVCSICSRGFTGNHNLKVHMKVHGITNLIAKKECIE